jgi:hypothetical protein
MSQRRAKVVGALTRRRCRAEGRTQASAAAVIRSKDRLTSAAKARAAGVGVMRRPVRTKRCRPSQASDRRPSTTGPELCEGAGPGIGLPANSFGALSVWIEARLGSHARRIRGAGASRAGQKGAPRDARSVHRFAPSKELRRTRRRAIRSAEFTPKRRKSAANNIPKDGDWRLPPAPLRT